MKKRNLTSLTALVLLLVIISLVLVSGTLAKYVEEVKADDTIIVAKWNVQLNDANGHEMSTTFNIFDKTKVYDLAPVDDIDDLKSETGEVDSDVEDGTTQAIVAPGTWGKVEMQAVVNSDTQVSLDYGFTIDEFTNASSIPLEFSLDGQTGWTSDPTTLSTTGTILETDITENKTVDATLYWRWKFYVDDAQDTADTTLGENPPTCNIKATFKAVQKD